ncbi:hypothetical protein T08_11842 [Trichinella sp. T8]|nr:hypothetical protein T08_11842 [Trichinella sp. T8]
MADKKGAAVNETDDVVRDTKADEQNISDKDQMESVVKASILQTKPWPWLHHFDQSVPFELVK